NHIYIETFSEVLILESIDRESDALSSVLAEELNAKVIHVEDTDNVPKTLDALREFDEIVLLNISNDDLPDGLDVLLHEYVHTIGGGLFTICGNEANSTQDDWTANAYTREDMYASLYQEMLPVEIVEYTAPVGVIVVIDTSGSMMGGEYEKTPLYWAMQGAQACLDALTERDYVGIMTLADSYTEELSLTPRTQRDKILATIAAMEDAAINGTLPSGGTLFSPALERAGKALAARSDLEKKHIIIVTDGEPSEADTELYTYWAQQNATLGVTLSIVGIDATVSAQNKMIDLITKAGCDKKNFHNVTKNGYDELPIIMREDLETPEIKSVNYETFTPEINVTNSITNGIMQDSMPTLEGYYGVKAKPDATVVLMGKFTPIYTQWNYGKGRVGTFACDLNGTWSADFLASEVGQKLINNIIYALFPTENVRASDVEATFTGDNYTTNLSIFTELGEGESIKVTVTSPSGAEQIFLGDAATGFSRMSFAVKETGLHTILVQKLNAEGVEMSSATLYKTLSYSKEYNAFADLDAAQALMESLAEDTSGYVIADPLEIFENAVEYLHIILDPRTLFSIMIIVCFLVDIAVRKFKWKWPHEIIREKRHKAAMANK
ncbi:MAG: VWA domain-containing protein, partial [Clostridia bacterium]|nr:VWA domain-containing protein [Clostridia bacterium]